jgi:hypothetical protein
MSFATLVLALTRNMAKQGYILLGLGSCRRQAEGCTGVRLKAALVDDYVDGLNIK